MREAGAPSTVSRNTPGSGVVPATPGAVMVAPPEVPRNVEGRKVKAAPRMGPKKRGQRQYKGRSPKAPAQSRMVGVFYSASSPIRRSLWRLARKFSGSWNATTCARSPRMHATNAASVSQT
jgi:hypothetical protein